MGSYREECPQILYEFLMYHKNIKNHSDKTVREYFLDLRMFLRFLTWRENPKQEFDEVSILEYKLDDFKDVRITDIHDFLAWLSEERGGGLSPAARSRKLMSIRSFFSYLTVTMNYFDKNPAESISPPRLRKSLPKYLSEQEANRLLNATNSSRDRALLMVMLGCGLRVSEVVSLNIDSIQEDCLRVLGKGNKERIVYLPEGTEKALNEYRAERELLKPKPGHEQALFISRNRQRITTRAVEQMVDKQLLAAGLDVSRYSPHKLRHTAATEMLRNGVDVRVLQEVLGHEHLNTTQIYTHVDNTDLKLAAKANKIGK